MSSARPEAHVDGPGNAAELLRRPSYGITADELHERIIEDMRAFCRHHGFEQEVVSRIFDGEKGRPLEQTIRMVCRAAMLANPEQAPAVQK